MNSGDGTSIGRSETSRTYSTSGHIDDRRKQSGYRDSGDSTYSRYNADGTRNFNSFPEESRRHQSSSSSRTSYSSSVDSDDLSRPQPRWNSGGFRSGLSDRDGNSDRGRSAGSDRDRISGQTGDGSRSSSSSSLSSSRSSSHSGGGWSHHSAADDSYYQYPDYNELEEEHNSGRTSSGGGGVTYTKTEFDENTGEAKVYSRRVFDDYATEWKEVSSSKQLHSDPLTDDLGSGSSGEQLRHTLRRVKRDKEMVVQPEAYTDDQTGRTLQVVNLRCSGDTPTAKCITIRCNIRNLGKKSSAVIRVRSRIWNATLVEDYAHVNLVNIESRGELILPEELRYKQDQSDDVATAETKAYANLLEQTKAVPLWVILVSIFAGLLILVLIILLLWKMGFFQRKRPDPTLSGNLAKNGY